MKKYGVEFIGTFALIFAGTGAIVINERRSSYHQRKFVGELAEHNP